MNKVIAVFSPAGGVGVSAIAAYLAYSFAQKSETAVLDMMPEFGSLSEYLDFNPTLPQDRLPLSFNIDSEVLNELSMPGCRRLKFFPSPPSTVSDVDWKHHINNCRRSFAFTLIDLPHTFMAPELSIGLEQADLILLLCQYHWPVVQCVRNFLDSSHAEVKSKCRLIMNNVEVLTAEIKESCHSSLDQKPFFEIWQDAALEGKCEIKKNSRFAKAVNLLAKRLDLSEIHNAE